MNYNDKTYDSMTEEEIDRLIMSERNESITCLTREVSDVSETMIIINSLLSDQGEFIEVTLNTTNIIDNYVETSVANLRDAEQYHSKNIKLVRDILVLTGGIVLGGLGFIGGPIVGVVTLTTSLCASGGIIYTTHKLK